MKSFSKKRARKGAILVITALLSTAIMGITALVVDLGYLYYKKNDLQTAVNASWLAGNDRLMKLRSQNSILSEKDKEAIKEHVTEVMKFNGFETNDENRVSCIIDDNRDLQISARCHVGLFFAKIIEVDSTTIAASRNTSSTVAGNADILPIAMSHGIIKWNENNNLVFQFFPKELGFVEGNEYIIKPGQTSDTSTICQGITDFTATGSFSINDYKKLMTYGYTNSLNLNDRISLICNGFTSETESAIKERLSSQTINDKVIIPIVEPTENISTIYGVATNSLPIYNIKNTTSSESQLKSIANAARITGFAEFKLLNESEYRRIGNDYKNGDEGSLGKAMKGQIRGIFLGYLVNPNQI